MCGPYRRGGRRTPARPIRGGRDGATVTIDRAAHRSGSPLEVGSEEGIEGHLAPPRGGEVGSQEVTLRRRQIWGDRDVARGEMEPGAEERRKRDPRVPRRRSGPRPSTCRPSSSGHGDRRRSGRARGARRRSGP